MQNSLLHSYFAADALGASIRSRKKNADGDRMQRLAGNDSSALRRRLMSFACFAAAEVALAALAFPSAAQQAAQRTAPAPNPPTMTAARQSQSPPKHDAVFKAAMERRTDELDKITPVTDKMLRHPPDGDWLIWRRTYAGQGYSPLRQINKSNVGDLRVAWSWSLPTSGNEITPLVHDGVLFVKSANRVEALDGATGDLLWQYIRPLPAWMHNGATEVVRTLAIYQDKLYVPTLDGHLLALDVKTGKIVWDHVVVNAEDADRSSDPERVLRMADGGPLVAHGEVIVGYSGCGDYKGGCFIVGLNAQSGHEDWRFNTIARPDQPGGNSWNGASLGQRFGASVWMAGTYDPDLNLAFFGTGPADKPSILMNRETGKSGAGQRGDPPGNSLGDSNDALYTDSTVVLVPNSGKLVWYYQHFNGDLWGRDWAYEQTLATLPVDGKPRKLVLTAGKLGIFDALDRTTGRYVFSKDLGLENLVTSIDPKTGKKAFNPALLPQPGKPNAICPPVRDEPSTSFDPATKIVYVPVVNDSCPASEGKFDGKYGRLEALNLETKKIVWIDRHRAPEVTAVLTTAGGLVFDGSMDREFRASDAMTGKVLWVVRLNSVPKSAAVTYSVHGQQYVAIAAGLPRENQPNAATPEIDNPVAATTLWVFKLPSKGGAAPS